MGAAAAVLLRRQHLGVPVDPGAPATVGARQNQVEDVALVEQPLLDGEEQRVDPLAGQGRDADRLAAGHGLAVTAVIAFMGIEQIGLVLDLENRMRFAVESELRQHGLDILGAAPRFPRAKRRGHAR